MKMRIFQQQNRGVDTVRLIDEMAMFSQNWMACTRVSRRFFFKPTTFHQIHVLGSQIFLSRLMLRLATRNEWTTQRTKDQASRNPQLAASSVDSIRWREGRSWFMTSHWFHQISISISIHFTDPKNTCQKVCDILEKTDVEYSYQPRNIPQV